MASITYSKEGGRIRFDSDDWLPGLIPQFSSSGFSRMTAAKGLTNTAAIDPFRLPGYLAPGNDASDYTNVSEITAVAKNAVNNGSNAYVTTASAKLHSLDLTTNTIANSGSWPKTVAGAGTHSGHTTFVLDDVILYTINGIKYLLYSYNDNIDGDIGRYDLGSTFVDNFMSDTAASGAAQSTVKTHPMIVGADDIVYIGDGNKMNAFDGSNGSNGTYTAGKLLLPTEYVITCFGKLGDHLVVFAYKDRIGGSIYSGEATAFFWDYVSADFDKVVPIQASYVNGAFNYQGTVGIFGQGNSSNLDSAKSSRMMMYDGSGFKPIAQFPESIPGRGGVFATDNAVYWNAAGVIYRHGSPHIGLGEALNKITYLGGTTAEGLLKNFVGATISCSAGTGVFGGLHYLNGGYRASAEAYTPFVQPDFPMDKHGKITRVKTTWYATPESSCHPLYLYLRSSVNNTITIYSGKTTVSANPSGTSLTETALVTSTNVTFDFLNMWLNYGAGTASALPLIIKSVEIYYENVSI